MGSQARRGSFLFYPEPVQAPYVPHKIRKKENPRLSGWVLVVAVYLIEWVGFIRRYIWRNAGFASLRNIRQYLDETEARFDPTVVPLQGPVQANEIDKNHEENYVNVNEGDDLKLHPSRSSSGSTATLRYSVADYRSLYVSGQLTPLAVAKTVLPLIRRDTIPPGEHSMAWINVKVDLILKAAKESTMRYKEKRQIGPLDGIPIAIKDEFDVEGYITTLGSASKPAGQGTDDAKLDSWCVQMLKDAGAIIMGKTTMVEYGMDTSGNNTTFGTPINPYNQQYYCGGSSSGSAYAVSTGIVPIAMGSDGGGSIRIPASYCSIVGLKPSHSRLSFVPCPNHASTCAVKAPMAADLGSLATLYSIVAQPHPSSPFHKSPPAIQIPLQKVEKPRIIGVPEAWLQESTAGVQALCLTIIKRLATEKGYKIVPIEMPFVKEGRIAHAMTMLTDASTVLPETSGISAGIRIMLALGRTTPATDFLLAQKLRRVLMQHLAWLWKTYPGLIIVTPTSGCAGWPIRSAAELKHGINDGNRTEESMEYVWMANFCGVPSITLPAGYLIPEGQLREGEIAASEMKEKVPVGLMATGEWASEESLMRFGIDVEELCGDTQCRPPNWVDIVEMAKLGTKDSSSL